MPRKSWTDPKGRLHTGEVVATVDGVDVIDCEVFGYRHVIPLPDPETLKAFYEEEFYQNEKADYLAASAEDIEWKQCEFTRRYQSAEKRLPESGHSGPKAVLDIGCGPGEFLALGQSRGWAVQGVEPSPVAAEYARSSGVDVVTGFFDAEMAQSLGQFDFVHMSEVLEHIPNPIEILEVVWGILKPGGVVCVSVPNDFSPVQQVLVETGEYKPWWVVPDHHLNYFDFDSLLRLFTKVGFEVFEKTTNFPMEVFLLMGQNYTQTPELGQRLHSWRKTFDMTMSQHNPDLLQAFYDGLANAGMGRLAVMFGQKPNDNQT